jgi:hypothetical protein
MSKFHISDEDLVICLEMARSALFYDPRRIADELDLSEEEIRRIHWVLRTALDGSKPTEEREVHENCESLHPWDDDLNGIRCAARNDDCRFNIKFNDHKDRCLGEFCDSCGAGPVMPGEMARSTMDSSMLLCDVCKDVENT